jgi:pimeloyl-ACP methyl ester carboxylesterase
VVALGVKIDWTVEEVAGARRMAARSPQVFPTAGEAADRHLKLAGLHELVDPADPVARAGVRVADGGWVAALDPRAFGAVGPSVETVLSRCEAPLRLAAGSGDPLVSLETMRRVDPDAVVIDEAGHNAHWEAPDAVWRLIDAGRPGTVAQ